MDIEILDKNKICAPTVRIPFNILEEIKFIVAHESEEIGWYGTVKELPDNVYEIGEIFIPEQERNGGTCELSAEGLNNITSEIIKNPNLSNEEKEDKINSIAFWGHSHVNFGVSPSSQDIDNAKKHSGKPYLIAARFNKAGNIRIDFFDFKRGLLFNDVLFSENIYFVEANNPDFDIVIMVGDNHITFKPCIKINSPNWRKLSNWACYIDCCNPKFWQCK